MASLPILAGHVAIMPDVHLGIGATVGTVIPTEGAIIPAAVGVDIGCGMNAVRLNLRAEDLPDGLRAVRSALEAGVPAARVFPHAARASQAHPDEVRIAFDGDAVASISKRRTTKPGERLLEAERKGRAVSRGHDKVVGDNIKLVCGLSEFPFHIIERPFRESRRSQIRDIPAQTAPALPSGNRMGNVRAGALLLHHAGQPGGQERKVGDQYHSEEQHQHHGQRGPRDLAHRLVLDDAQLRSLLCVPLSTPDRAAILVAAHATPSFFTTRHVALARSFASMAARMLDTLDTRAHAQERHVSEARARALTRTNEQLREQLLTIKTQQHEIQRLRAPILLVAPRTLVVPLVGELDPAALLQVTESLLQALTTHRARTIILDLSAFDSTQVGVAERLTALARTTGSLGARCLLCGLRPALAVSLAAEGSMALQTYASLASALASAT